MIRWMAERPAWVTVVLCTVVAVVIGAMVPEAGAMLWVALMILGLVLRWATQRQIRTRSEHELGSGEATDVTVVGLDHHPAAQHLRTGGVPLTLRREPTNQHDANAIAVHSPQGLVGYIPANQAMHIAPEMDARFVKQMILSGRYAGDGRLTAPIPTVLLPAAPEVRWRDHGKVLEPWNRDWREYEVADEYLHREDVRAVFAGRQTPIPAEGTELHCTGYLAFDPDDATIRLIVDGHPVGVVERADYTEVAEVVLACDKAGSNPQVFVRLWALSDDGVIRSRVTYQSATADDLMPPMPLPPGALVLPVGRKAQVTGEEAHLNELTTLLAGRPVANAVATLHRTELAGRAKPRVVVKIDGEQVGTLTPATSEHYLSIIDAAEEEGRTVVVRATVSGNQLKADVTINAARAGELSDAWLADHLYGQPAEGSH